jgi:hypothetical protein
MTYWFKNAPSAKAFCGSRPEVVARSTAALIWARVISGAGIFEFKWASI